MDRESRLFAEQIEADIRHLLERELAPATERDPWLERALDLSGEDAPATARSH